MTTGGIILIKFWLEVGNKEQERRFRARIDDPLRQWKLSAMDLPSRARWYEYSRARDAMLKATDKPVLALVHRPLRRQAARAPRHHRAPVEADSTQEDRSAQGQAAIAVKEACVRRRSDDREAPLRPKPLLIVFIRRAILGSCLTILAGVPLGAQTPTGQTPPAAPPSSITAAFGVERSGESSTIHVSNRPIVTLRARVLGRGPSERAAGAERILGDLLEQRISEPVESRTVEGTVVISVASRGVLVVTPADVDDLAGETLEGVTSQAVAQLRLALHEAIEARTPAVILGLTARALAGLSVGVLLLWALHRGQRIAAAKLVAISERTLARTGIDDVEALRASRLFDLQRWVVTAVTGGLALVVAYSTSTFVLRSFPYTRPWGESMSHFLLMTSEDLALSIANAIPGLFTVALIFVLARFVVRAGASGSTRSSANESASAGCIQKRRNRPGAW